MQTCLPLTSINVSFYLSHYIPGHLHKMERRISVCTKLITVFLSTLILFVWFTPLIFSHNVHAAEKRGALRQEEARFALYYGAAFGGFISFFIARYCSRYVSRTLHLNKTPVARAPWIVSRYEHRCDPH